MTDKRRQIDELRQETAKIDAQLLSALEKRARISRQIGELRKDDPTQLALTDLRTFHALVARASGEMPSEDLRGIFREIFASCLALELPVKITYVGPAGGAAHTSRREPGLAPTPNSYRKNLLPPLSRPLPIIARNLPSCRWRRKWTVRCSPPSLRSPRPI